MKKGKKACVIYSCLTKEGMRFPLTVGKKPQTTNQTSKLRENTEGSGAFDAFQRGGLPEAPMAERLLPINPKLSLIIFSYIPLTPPFPF